MVCVELPIGRSKVITDPEWPAFVTFAPVKVELVGSAHIAIPKCIG